MRICVVGGAGYVGHVLVPRLLSRGHEVVVLDTLWYGCRLPNNPKLRVIKGDVRDLKALGKAFKGVATIIHLACISNDSSFELDEALSREINFESFDPLVVEAAASGVHRFIFASTSSVYGVSDAPNVTEDHPLVPVTHYNRYKAECEPVLLKYAKEAHRPNDPFTCVILRPATLCGYSPRLRLDLSVNALVNHAVTNGAIRVFGGAQMRPNLHIEDMVDVYELMLTAPHDKIHGEIFNVGAENMSINDLAKVVQHHVGKALNREIFIQHEESSDDKRSYRVNSDKIKNVLGYTPQRCVHLAVEDLVRAFQNHLIPNSMDDDRYYNVRTMKALGVT